MSKKLFLLLIGVLILQRFFHIYNIIEDAHSWRQYDTLFYAYDFFTNGLDLLRPSVAWLGNYKTLILEFPVISAIMSFMYYIPGPPITYMKIISFLFFLLSTYFLYKIVCLLYYKRLAQLTVITYLSLPLSLFYSVALNIDFAEMAMVLAMIYYYLIGYERQDLRLILMGTFLGIFGCLIKVPYMLLGYAIIFYFIIKEKRTAFFLKTLPITVIPVCLFILWQMYSMKINNQAPDWEFIPGYIKFINMSFWYFGDVSLRLNPVNWIKIAIRLCVNTISLIGLPFFVYSFFVRIKNKMYFHILGLGFILYVIIFFNLNLIHEYYQIPFLIISSFYISVGIDSLKNKFTQSLLKSKYIISAVLLLLCISNISFTEITNYKPDYLRLSASDFIKRNTSINDVIIASIEDTDPRDPRILSASYRKGWSIKTSDLNKDLLDSLKNYGANYLAIVSDKEVPENIMRYFNESQLKSEMIDKDKWKIFLFKF
ncbi:MAG: glycosyltransferase family 39 protein [Bacteroidetes bacterium]|nr:glycosyltransferase family 39 protein [Bacteroidota bacterium]